MNTLEPIGRVRQYSTSEVYRERVASRIWLSLAPAAQWSNRFGPEAQCHTDRALRGSWNWQHKAVSARSQVKQ